MKKFISFVLAALMICTLLNGCSKKADTPAEEQSEVDKIIAEAQKI